MTLDSKFLTASTSPWGMWHTNFLTSTFYEHMYTNLDAMKGNRTAREIFRRAELDSVLSCCPGIFFSMTHFSIKYGLVSSEMTPRSNCPMISSSLVTHQHLNDYLLATQQPENQEGCAFIFSNYFKRTWLCYASSHSDIDGSWTISRNDAKKAITYFKLHLWSLPQRVRWDGCVVTVASCLPVETLVPWVHDLNSSEFDVTTMR